MQVWQWVSRQPGQPAAYREHHYHLRDHTGESLIQQLESIRIPLNEEDAIDLTGTVHKLRDAFDRDRLTKKFYDHFKREHAAFLGFIQGITEQADREWYASLMLNRMMFVYFIQRKSEGFLDGDRDYLKNRLEAVQRRQGKGKFLTFYRYFLLCLFHQGFSRQPALRDLSPDLAELLGHVLVPLDEGQVLEAVAVCYLFAFKNARHERRTREIIHSAFPDLPVSLSSEVDPTYREYERTCLTAFDAYLRPVVEGYIQRLEGALSGMGIEVGLHVMQSRGGVTSARIATDRPVTMVLSGPAAGVLGGAFVGERAGWTSVITLDMGGTSCDVALVRGGAPAVLQRRAHRPLPVAPAHDRGEHDRRGGREPGLAGCRRWPARRPAERRGRAKVDATGNLIIHR